jgi:hypothetical protein
MIATETSVGFNSGNKMRRKYSNESAPAALEASSSSGLICWTAALKICVPSGNSDESQFAIQAVLPLNKLSA